MESIWTTTRTSPGGNYHIAYYVQDVISHCYQRVTNGSMQMYRRNRQSWHIFYTTASCFRCTSNPAIYLHTEHENVSC